MRNAFSNLLVLAALAVGVAPAASAHGPVDGGEKLTMLQEPLLADSPGKKVLFFTVDYEPGQKSIPHVHGGSAVVYVLEGSVVSQLAGEAPVTYGVGDSWYERPQQDHLVSRNASATQPAKLLVWILNDENAPLLTPLQAQGTTR